MSIQVIMPQLGESIVEGTVARWLIQEGQSVQRDEPLFQVSTDKVETEIPAPDSGVLLKIYVPEGQTVAKGTVLAEIGEQGLGVGHSSGSDSPRTAESKLPITQYPIPVTPIAQRLAAAHGLDLEEVSGTGPGGRITKDDVEAHLASVSDIEDPAIPNPQSLIPDPGFISPVVARLSAELGVDLSQVIGTGTGGRITKKDVLAYVAAPVPRDIPLPLRQDEIAPETSVMLNEYAAQGTSWRMISEASPSSTRLFAGDVSPAMLSRQPAQSDMDGPLAADEERASPLDSQLETTTVPLFTGEYDVLPLSIMRRSIAKHMALSVQTAPHVTTVMEADMTRVVGARERLRAEFERQGVKLTLTPFFVQAIISGLRAVPEANSSFREDALLLHRRTHIGVAVALPDGLIVPVIRDADGRSLLGLARAVNDLATRARTKQLKPEEAQGGTFTLTNHGTSGSLFATPIIVQPQAGILGVGVIQKRAVVVGAGHPILPDAQDAIAIRPMAYLSFTFDHRVLDGAGADRFLSAVKQFLEDYTG